MKKMSTFQKRLCCVRGCSTPQDFVRETLFPFPGPAHTNRRCKRWLELYPNTFTLQQEAENFICGRHFTEECFNKNGGLLHRANPSINIDTSYAKDILMKSFIMKVIYEWVLRHSVVMYELVIWDRVLEAKVLLGMKMNTLRSVWIGKFTNFKCAIEKLGARFGSGQNGPKNILGIIKDIRKELPSNFVLPADNIVQGNLAEDSIKKEAEEDSIPNVIIEVEEPADEPIRNQNLDVVPSKSLDTYQEALELLDPLKDYVKRIGNENASLRLKEIEAVLKNVIRSDSQPKRSLRRRRN